MLEAESTERESCCVQWSSSGTGFSIADVSLFSKEILPKYFKTTKFSSFQRNLNLVSWYQILWYDWRTYHMMCLSSSRDHSIVNLSTSTYAYTLIHQYGFTKKSRKRGPEADGMYSHPGFVRGNCEGLSLLRKRTKTKSIIQKNQASSISSFPSPG